MPTLPPTGDLVLVQMGGLGDLVLLAAPMAALRQARPSGRLTLVCRSGVVAMAELLPVPPDEVIALDLDPLRWETYSNALEEALEPVVARLQERRAVLLIDAAHRPSWFGEFLAALLKTEQALCCPGAPEPARNALRRLLLARFTLEERDVQRLTVPPRLHERERHRQWLAALGLDLPPATTWLLSTRLRDLARDWLGRVGFREGTYLVCCPGGGGTTPLKRWGEANFAAVLRNAGLPVLLLGDAAEEEQLARLAGLVDGLPLARLAATPEELPLAAGLTALARGWLANDSGPSHLGQAYGIPGVAVFGGGGRWPSYAPWTPGALGVVCPLPCFGCDWDCLLGHALCVESVGVEAVEEALRRCLAAPAAPPEIITVAGPETPVRQLLADASDSYRAAQRDREQRLEALLDASLQSQRQGERVAALERDLAEERKQSAGLQRAATERQAALTEKERENGMLAQVAAARLALLENVHAEAEKRAIGMRELTAAVAERETRIAALQEAAAEMRAFQISIGLGAGNIGDELMANAFWRQVPDRLGLDVALFPESGRQHAGYPSRHRYVAVDWGGNENASAEIPGLLVGATPVTEAEGLDWPLRFLTPRLLHFHARGLPVDAVGVGVEPLASAEARQLFAEAFAPIRSWTVRSGACRDALLALGVAPHTVKVGADWAWLYRPQRDLRAWAADYWRQHGIDPERPLLVANIVNMQWRDRAEVRQAIATGLDAAAARHGLQLAFFCNECRDGEFFDFAAAQEVAALLRSPAIVLPNAYYSPDEAIALLGYATVTLGQRYHFIVESVLANTVPISIPRGAKMQVLAAELGIAEIGSVLGVDEAALTETIGQELAERQVRLLHLAERKHDLTLRAAGNLDLLRGLPPYAALWPETK